MGENLLAHIFHLFETKLKAREGGGDVHYFNNRLNQRINVWWFYCSCGMFHVWKSCDNVRNCSNWDVLFLDAPESSSKLFQSLYSGVSVETFYSYDFFFRTNRSMWSKLGTKHLGWRAFMFFFLFKWNQVPIKGR